MQAVAAFNRAAFTARPLHRPPRPLLRLAGAEDALAGRRGAPLTRPRCSGSFSVGVGSYGSEHTPVFPRQQAWDPYKLLGVDHDASEEEVRGARNFLLKQYAGYEESEEAIEGAYDKIIMNSYSHRKKSKINLKNKLKKQVEESPSWLKALLGYFEVPPVEIISRRLAFFAFIAGWSIATSAETGPAFQLALSLASCIYFLNEKMKNLVRASTTGETSQQSSKLEIPAVITKKIALAGISTANPNVLISGPPHIFGLREYDDLCTTVPCPRKDGPDFRYIRFFVAP